MMRLVYCLREAFDTAYARINADGVPVEDDTLPHLVSGGNVWSRIQSGELKMHTCKGMVVDVDLYEEFEDQDFLVQDTSGDLQEFSLERAVSDVAVGSEALVRYVQTPFSIPSSDGSTRWVMTKIEVWLGGPVSR